MMAAAHLTPSLSPLKGGEGEEDRETLSARVRGVQLAFSELKVRAQRADEVGAVRDRSMGAAHP